MALEFLCISIYHLRNVFVPAHLSQSNSAKAKASCAPSARSEHRKSQSQSRKVQQGINHFHRVRGSQPKYHGSAHGSSQRLMVSWSYWPLQAMLSMAYCMFLQPMRVPKYWLKMLERLCELRMVRVEQKQMKRACSSVQRADMMMSGVGDWPESEDRRWGAVSL